MQRWSGHKDVLLKARDALHVLEAFCVKWQNGDYTEYRHYYLNEMGLSAKVSGESSSVQQDPKKKEQRMFWLEDGRKVYCEYHIKLPSGYRLHFYPDASKKQIYVAYLGKHLMI